MTGCYGVRGWVRLHLYTETLEGLLSLPQLWLRNAGVLRPLQICEARMQGKGVVARFQGLDDRTHAELLRGSELVAEESALPEPASGEFYWRQLEGLKVWCIEPADVAGSAAEQPVLLGAVHHLLETGANDVLVVRPCAGSIDQCERLLPYLPGEVVTAVDLAAGRMDVRWYLEV